MLEIAPVTLKGDRLKQGRVEQRRSLRTKALMWYLGTRLACRHKSFCKNWKNIMEINQ